MEAIVEQICETCRYADDYGSDEYVYCRRYPPMVVRGSAHPEKAYCEIVPKECTCGEWKTIPGE